jgi:ribosome-binding ATPase YchF (GTP1/OBG family)
MKPQLYVCNVDEQTMRGITGRDAAPAPNPYVEEVRKRAATEGSEAVIICGKFEAELADIADETEKLAIGGNR